MAVPKAQTLQQRFGFMDNDLKKPKHDDIILWLDNQIDTHLFDWLRFQEEFNGWTKNHINLPLNSSKSKDDIAKEFKFPVMHPPTVEKKVWEYPVYSEGYKGGKYIIGFADIAVTYTRPLRLNYVYDRVDGGSYAYGLYPEYTEGFVFFEVKAEIPSMGELVRQIRMYQEYVHGKWFVVSPDDKFESHLATQGIQFIKYPG